MVIYLQGRYNERALLSVFAGAVWRTGGHAFEEFSETKLKGMTKKESSGRIDLWFETSGGEFRAEVKDAEIPITRKSQQLRSLRALMKRAIKDARCNPADGGDSRRLAISFAVPYLLAKQAAKAQQAQIDWFYPSLNTLITTLSRGSFHLLKSCQFTNAGSALAS